MFLLGARLSSGELSVCNNLPTLMAGRGEGRLLAGHQTRFPEGTRTANLWLTTVHVMGLKQEWSGHRTEVLERIPA